MLPRTPHVGNMLGMQVPFEQHPIGHDVKSQMQFPDAQWVPAEHAAAMPHLQAPVTRSQESAVTAEQAVHAAPPTPQALGDATMQVFPLAQQPLGQEAASHTQAPATQLLPAPQAGLAPHKQAPDAPHMSARAGSQLTHAAPPPPQVDSPP